MTSPPDKGDLGGWVFHVACLSRVSCTVSVVLSEGSNTFTAAATDRAGNISVPSAVVTITLDTAAPTKPVISTQAQAVNAASFTVSGTAEVGATIQILSSGNIITRATTTANSNGEWTIPVTLIEGVNTITATATDRAGNISYQRLY